MDPSIINEASFSAANPSSYSLAELWTFSSSGNGSGSGDLAAGLGLRMGSFSSLGGADISAVTFNEASSVTEHSGGGGGGGGERKRKDASSIEEASQQLATTSNANVLNDSTRKRPKASIGRDENGDSGGGAGNIKPEPPKDYIHVRARRGQAKDSHSLAERARREKISERMRILQDLVPGCNKVIGKALVLDEIINYIQSLQRQVEFLSLKLEAVNSKMSPVMEGYPPKEYAAPTYSTGMIFGSQPAREYEQGGTHSEWLHMQVGGSFERTS